MDVWLAAQMLFATAAAIVVVIAFILIISFIGSIFSRDDSDEVPTRQYIDRDVRYACFDHNWDDVPISRSMRHQPAPRDADDEGWRPRRERRQSTDDGELFGWMAARNERDQRNREKLIKKAREIWAYHPRLRQHEVEMLAREDWNPQSGRTKAGGYWWSQDRCSVYIDEIPLYQDAVDAARGESFFRDKGVKRVGEIVSSAILAHHNIGGSLHCTADKDVITISPDEWYDNARYASEAEWRASQGEGAKGSIGHPRR